MKSIQLEKLADPFLPESIEWRVGQCGVTGTGKPWAKLLAYLTARDVMDRLDEVCGPGNWRDEYTAGPAGGVLCGLSILIDGQWVTKWDGAENTDVEQVKGGLSDAFKRAAVKWGIGRDLYAIGTTWADCTLERPDDLTGWHNAKAKSGETIYWRVPAAKFRTAAVVAASGGRVRPASEMQRPVGAAR